MMCTPLYVAGIGLAVTGAIGLTGNIAAIQTLGGASMVSNGLQSVFNGILLMSGACNPVSIVLGMVGVIAGVAGMAFGTAEVQEGLGCGNWIKDSGMSEGLYERSMLITGAVSLFVNIAGPIANKYGAKCFAAGTAVHTKTGLKAIEEIEVGDEVLSYDEETGTQGYKPVVRLYRNVTEEWYVIRVNGEELRCTAEHPFYVVKRDEFVPARNLKKGDELLQSDGRYGIIEAVEVERLAKPEMTYNFEVAEYHTYYVGSGILTHNKCVPGNTKSYSEYESRNAAFRATKRKAGIPMSQQPIRVEPSVNKFGKRLVGRTYYFEKGNNISVIMEHAAGHIKGGIGPHFNILGLDWHFLYPR